MSTKQNEHDWSDDQELTAYAFGELEGSELAAFEARIAGDEAAQALVAELRSLGSQLESELAAEAQPALSDEQRQSIERELEPAVTLRPIKRRVGSVGWLAMAAGLGALCFGLNEYYREEILGLTGGTEMSYALARKPGASPAPASAKRSNLQGLGYTSEESDHLQALGYTVDNYGGKVSEYEVRSQTLAPETKASMKDLGYLDSGDDDGEDSPQGGLPSETLSREAYERIYENPFQRASEAPLSTFSVDVDTASYANMRRFLESGSLPPADAVRIEELINYFPYAYPEPSGPHPFSVHTEVGSAPWAPAHRLVRIGLQAKHTLPAERRGSNLVFLLDVSGSMNSGQKLPLLKKALHLLVQQLDERDTISIVVYAGASGVVLPPTRCDLGVNIHMALERLEAGGSTNGGAGIELAYRLAQENFLDGGINRVILGTDGDFNVGVSSNGELTRLIEEKAKTGVFLSVLGFGSGNLQDSKMEQLADKGNGNYAYIDSVMEARKVLVEEMGSTLETVAKDVKLQVEFNPSLVQAYRLIGYENRMLATRDFNDDKKDAGEIGAGHSVTAIYEVVPLGVEIELPAASKLRYQTPDQAAPRAFGGELLNVALRYKQPTSDTSTRLDHPVEDATANFHELSSDTRWAATVGAFGMLLRKSEHSGSATFGEVTQWAAESLGEDAGGYRAQFIGLVGKARQLMQE